MDSKVFTQAGYRCRLEWGRHGARAAAARGDVLVIVDTLSFSTAAATAIHHGGQIYPCADTEAPEDLARRVDAVVAVPRHAVPELGRYSLSPSTFVGIAPGTRVVLPSPNGATCSRYAGAAPHLFVGALVNAAATAAAVSAVVEATGRDVTVVACGERWRPSNEDGDLRVAVEDLLGAGAFLAHLLHNKSPEARVCEGAFRLAAGDLEGLLWECASGRELRAAGYGEDVRHAARLNRYDTAAVMRDGCLTAWRTDYLRERTAR